MDVQEELLETSSVFVIHTSDCSIGVIIDDGGNKYYVTGDTLYNEEIFKDIPQDIHTIFLPVNGVGNNMNMTDAKKFCERICPQYAVPMADKKEVNINFDGVDLTPYVDNGYLAFCITMSKVPTKLRVYPYSVYTDAEGEHALRPNTASTPSLDGMKADTPFWIYLPLKDLIKMNGTCKTSNHIDAQKKVICNGQYTLTSFGKLIIQPQIEATDNDSKKSDYTANPITVEVKDLGLYV